jgi:hypothetical protein
MKISKLQLRQIIQEELNITLAEGEGEAGLPDAVMYTLKKIPDLKMRRMVAFLVIRAVGYAADKDMAEWLAIQIDKEDPELRVDPGVTE